MSTTIVTMARRQSLKSQTVNAKAPLADFTFSEGRCCPAYRLIVVTR